MAKRVSVFEWLIYIVPAAVLLVFFTFNSDNQTNHTYYEGFQSMPRT